MDLPIGAMWAKLSTMSYFNSFWDQKAPDNHQTSASIVIPKKDCDVVLCIYWIYI